MARQGQGRDELGRFVKGAYPGGPGRPKRSTEADYLQALKDVVTRDVWLGIVRRATADALKGNATARAWLADYLIGKPPQILDIRAADAKLLADVIKRLEEVGATPADVFNAMLVELASVEHDDLGA